MRFSIYWMTAALILIGSILSAQAFEGVLTLKVSTKPDQISVMTIKDDKTMLEMQVDSIQKVKLIKDRSAETTTILRTNKDLKYGYRSKILYGEDVHTPTINPEVHQVVMTVTAEEKYFGSFRCVKAVLSSPKATAEAWITKQPGLRLSACFQHFLGEGTDIELYVLREVADQEGLIMYYRESLKANDNETIIEVTAEEKAITLDVFAIDPGFTVLDEEGVKRLYGQAQADPVKMAQWQEFRQIFGNE